MPDAGRGRSQSVDPTTFAETVGQVRAFVRSEPGAWSALAEHARAEPERVTSSLLALGTVLLDLAAEAFQIAPEAMLDKVTHTIDLHRLEQSREADSR